MAAKFNIRVYGICINENDEILLSDEYIKHTYITKFPGGGLEFGESTKDCLIREWKEETGAKIVVLNHFYTTDFLQFSAFNPNSQVIGIYYKVEIKSGLQIPTKTKPFDFEKLEDDAQVFRRMAISELNENSVTFPTDKKVVQLLKKEYGKK